MKNYDEFVTLYQKRRNTGRLSKEQSRKLQKHERIENLAYEFSQSHRYMLEKDSYSQQDTDYAFQLGNKEKDGAFSDEMTQKNLFASDIYKSLIFEKVFAGQKERITQAVTEGKKDGYSLSKWLEEDMAECVNSRKDEMTKIIRSLANNLKDNGEIVKNPTQYQIQTQLHFAIQENWLNQLFRGSEEQDISKSVDNAWGSVSTTWGKLYSAFSPIIDQIIKEMPKPKDEVEEED